MFGTACGRRNSKIDQNGQIYFLRPRQTFEKQAKKTVFDHFLESFEQGSILEGFVFWFTQ